MDKELCFVIEGKELYLDQILVDYDDIPIFYLCKSGDEQYLVLSADLEEEKYIIVKPSRREILDMLCGKTAMRDVMTGQSFFWEVFAKEECTEDIVTKKDMCQVPDNVLPYKDAYFKAATPQIKEYITRLEQMISPDTLYEIDGVEFFINTDVFEPKRIQHYVRLYEYAAMLRMKVSEDYNIPYLQTGKELSATSKSFCYQRDNKMEPLYFDLDELGDEFLQAA